MPQTCKIPLPKQFFNDPSAHFARKCKHELTALFKKAATLKQEQFQGFIMIEI
jgi:hypothetical protein